MRVVRGENSRYTLFDLITNKEKDYHVSDMKPFIFSADLVDPVDVVRRDYMEFFIENVISDRGNLKRKTELEFQVKWLGYDETYNSWIHMQICVIQINFMFSFAKIICCV